MQNPFSNSFGFNNPILDFLKETHSNETTGKCLASLTIFISMLINPKIA